MKYNIAIVGATGIVGRKMLEVMEERKLPVNKLYLFASKKSEGTLLYYNGKPIRVSSLTEENIINKNIDIAIFSAGAEVSDKFAPIFAANGATVIDNSSRWRKDANVPLIVPEVNGQTIESQNKIIANPNCSVIQSAVCLAPLHKKFGIKRIVYSTYQAVSGAGNAGRTDLINGIKGLAPQKFKKPIFSNVLPHIDEFLPNGYTKEEEKMIFETKKILNDDTIKITATTVRVPVFNCHSVCANVEFCKPITLAEIEKTLSAAKSVKYFGSDYPTPFDVNETDDVYIGRLRMDESIPYGINLWIVADNIRKGAATNAIQIAEILIKRRYAAANRS